MSVSKTITMCITIDADSGKVIQVGTTNKESVEPIKGSPIKELVLKGLTQNPTVLITSHSSPGCITYIVNGQYYRI